MKKEIFEFKDEYDLDTLIDSINTKILQNTKFHKYLFTRILKENNQPALKILFKKNIILYSFLSDSEKYIITQIYLDVFIKNDFYTLKKILRDTRFGNIIFISLFLNSYDVLNNDNISIFNDILDLNYIYDESIWEYINKQKKLYLIIDERIENSKDKFNYNKIVDIIEKMFLIDLFVSNQSFIDSILRLYQLTTEVSFKNKSEILKSIYLGSYDLFFTLLNRFTDFNISSIEELINNYDAVYNTLISRSIPIFFDYSNLLFNGVISNNNAYFAIILLKNGEKTILNPFSQIELDHVQKIYDPVISNYVTPIEYLGEIRPYEIHSFNKMKKNRIVSEEELLKIKNLSEDEIEIFLGELLEELNKTPHGPIERVDFWSCKININNADDIREAGIIIKGRSYNPVSLRSVSTNIIKAMDEPIPLIILMYVGNITDEVKHYFKNECNAHRKMYAYVDSLDLAKIWKAYT